MSFYKFQSCVGAFKQRMIYGVPRLCRSNGLIDQFLQCKRVSHHTGCRVKHFQRKIAEYLSEEPPDPKLDENVQFIMNIEKDKSNDIVDGLIFLGMKETLSFAFLICF